MLIGVVNSNNGDVIKFCGDALIIMWPFSADIDEAGKRAGAVFASLCALQLLSECDSFVREVPDSDAVVNLRLHCSISCGIVHCMCVGELQRWEFIVSGDPLQEIGEALNTAEAGSVCITKGVYELVNNVLQCVYIPTASSGEHSKKTNGALGVEGVGVYLLTGEA